MRVLESLESAIRSLRAGAWECGCGAKPRIDGEVEHGRGCYQVSADGGGTEYVGHPIADVLYELLQDLLALSPVVRALAYGRIHHGPDASGGDGPCDRHCVKCAWETYLEAQPKQIR